MIPAQPLSKSAALSKQVLRETTFSIPALGIRPARRLPPTVDVFRSRPAITARVQSRPRCVRKTRRCRRSSRPRPDLGRKRGFCRGAFRSSGHPSRRAGGRPDFGRRSERLRPERTSRASAESRRHVGNPGKPGQSGARQQTRPRLPARLPALGPSQRHDGSGLSRSVQRPDMTIAARPVSRLQQHLGRP
jgi:hypothetical protein